MRVIDYLPKIIFEGNEYIIVDGAIATREAYMNGTVSYAHLMNNGRIMRFHKQIGTKEDITYTGEFVEANPDRRTFFKGLDDPGWPWNKSAPEVLKRKEE